MASPTRRKLQGRPALPDGDAADITYPMKLSENLLNRLKAIKQETDVPVTAQIRQAIELYLGTEEDASTPDIPLPVIGSSVCGPLSEAIADTDEIRWLSEDMRRWLRAPEYACLIHAAGNSMERAGILDGDLLLLVPLPENARPRNGEITLVQIFTTDGGCESTVKYFHYANGEVVLRDGDGQEIKLPKNKERVEPIATVIGRIGRI